MFLSLDQAIENRHRRALLEQVQRYATPQVKHGSDLLYCHEKRERSKANVEKAARVTTLPNVHLGVLVEEGLYHDMLAAEGYIHHPKIPVQRNDPRFEFVEGKDGYIVVARKVGKHLVVVTPDFVHFERRHAIEVKAPGWLKEEPSDHYKMQARMQLWFFEDYIRVVSIWQIHTTGRSEFIVDDPMTDEEVLKLVEEPQSPRYSWECGGAKWKCDYADDCKFSLLKKGGTGSA